MLHSVTDGTPAAGMESSSFHAEASSSPGLSEPAVVEQGRSANASTSSGAFTGFATETVSVRSAKIPSSSSFQSHLTSELCFLVDSGGSSHCPVVQYVVHKILVHWYIQYHLWVHSGGCFHQRTQNQTPTQMGNYTRSGVINSPVLMAVLLFFCILTVFFWIMLSEVLSNDLSQL